MNLFSLLLTTIPGSSVREATGFVKPQRDSKDTYVPPLNDQFLYESFIPLEAVTFYIGAYHPTTVEINKLVRCILGAKEKILRNKSVIGTFFNFSEIKTEKGELGSIIECRNSIIDQDSSMIFKNILTRNLNYLGQRMIEETSGKNPAENENYNTVRYTRKHDYSGSKTNRAVTSVEKILKDPGKDEEYKNMVNRLRDAVLDNLNIQKRLELERKEFYREYESISKSELRNAEIALSLGGFILRLPRIYTVVEKLNIPNKSSVVRQWVNGLMAPVSELSLNIKHKSPIDQKIIITSFLNDCLFRNGTRQDSVFELRSEMLSMTQMSLTERIDENIAQETEIKNIIRVIENTKGVPIKIVHNSDVVEKFITYLLTNQDLDKNKLLGVFK